MSRQFQSETRDSSPVNHYLHLRIEEYTGVIIISGKNDKIRQMIIQGTRRGVTVYKGNGDYGKWGEACDFVLLLLFSVIVLFFN